MGLFDHLFKTKAPAGGEKVEEHAAEGSAAKPADAPPKTPLPPKEKADPSAFLHPKSYVPRGAPGLIPAPRPAASAIINKGAERRPQVVSPPPAADEIILTLGDVLSRIPTNCLKPGNHDAKRELRFKINDLSSDIARGRAAVPLSRIAQLVPDIFTRQISRDEDMEIRLPLQKLVEQIGLLRSRPKTSAVEKITPSLTATELPSAVKPVVPVEAQKVSFTTAPSGPILAAQASVVEPLAPAGPLPPTPPIVLSEPVVAPKTVELKASAEPVSTAASVILGPPPTSETSVAPVVSGESVPLAVPFVPISPVPPAPPRVPVSAPPEVQTSLEETPVPTVEAPTVPPAQIPEPLLETRPPVEAFKPEPKPIPAVVPKPLETLVSPAAVIEPEKIVIDWGSEIFSKEDLREPKESAIHDVVAEATRIEPVVEEPPAAPEEEVLPAEPVSEEPKLAPLESPDIDSDEEKIHLSLAAILRQCPREILVGEMPQVDDRVRITLPFAPIDRQLVKGRVEVSALRFIVAVPEVYQKYFVAKLGVKVPIPLEEVFQNLPSPKQELTPVTPTPPPVVLAPLPPPPVSVPPPPVTVEETHEEPAIIAPEPVAFAPAELEAETPESVSMPVEPAAVPAVSSEETQKAEMLAETFIEQEKEIAPAALEISTTPAIAAEPVEPAEFVANAEPVEVVAELPLPIVPPIIGVPESSTAEKIAQPPLPTPLEITPKAEESSPAIAIPAIPLTSIAPESAATTDAVQGAPAGFVPPWLSVETAPAAAQATPSTETPVLPVPAVNAVPPINLASASSGEPPVTPVPEASIVATPTISSAEVNAAPGENVPKLKLQRPIFRPHFVPPPPIFGFTPPPAALEPEPVAKAEPPSVLAGLTEGLPAALASTPPEMSNEVLPVVESAAGSSPGASADLAPTDPSAVMETPEEKPARVASEAEPSAEMIALADEHAAPDIAHFSGEPVPFADLAETLAHETTYASDLAAVVHVDLPSAEPVAAQATVAEEPEKVGEPAEIDEHRPVPIAEGLATAAVAVSITDHVPLDFHEVVAPTGVLQPAEETTAPAEASSLDARVESEESEASVAVEESESVELAEDSNAIAASAEAESVTPVEVEQVPVTSPESIVQPIERAAVPTPVELPAAPVPAPPPHPLFPLPKVSVEPLHAEVLPPPSLPLRRFDQDAIQALFMTEETLDLPKISRLAAGLPGVYACVIATRDQACTGGTLPEGFDLAALLGLAPRVGEAAGRMPIGQLKHFTLYGDAYSVSFFERNGLSLCAVHRPRSFVPGVREKLVALADELSR